MNSNTIINNKINIHSNMNYFTLFSLINRKYYNNDLFLPFTFFNKYHTYLSCDLVTFINYSSLTV